jgi:hypothetical protein
MLFPKRDETKRKVEKIARWIQPGAMAHGMAVV